MDPPHEIQTHERSNCALYVTLTDAKFLYGIKQSHRFRSRRLMIVVVRAPILLHVAAFRKASLARKAARHRLVLARDGLRSDSGRHGDHRLTTSSLANPHCACSNLHNRKTRAGADRGLQERQRKVRVREQEVNRGAESPDPEFAAP